MTMTLNEFVGMAKFCFEVATKWVWSISIRVDLWR